MPQAACATAAIATWMAVWWMTEAIPLAATALIPILAFPVAGVFPTGEGHPSAIRQAAAPYGSEFIFLFLGGFVIALAIEKWKLHRRVAHLTLKLVGTKPVALVAGFMIATALLSMWISNTASSLLMLPIAMSVVALVEARLGADDGIDGDDGINGDDEIDKKPTDPAEAAEFARSIEAFSTCLILAIAYAASIGGVATLIGTPPNVFLASFLREDFGIELSFGRWLGAILPLCIFFLALTWFLLTRVLFPVRLREIPGGRAFVESELHALGPISRGERIVLVVFLVTASLWILRGPLARWGAFVDVFPWWVHIHDTSVALFGALLLFVIPVNWKERIFAIDWETARQLPWGVLLLFGGGLSLAGAVKSSGLAAWISGQFPTDLPLPILVVLVTTTIVFLTELSSNLATVNVFLPVLGALATARGEEPQWIVIPAAIAASFAFMLPVATPPNAIVFGSGKVLIGEMIRAGIWLNLLSVLLIPLYIFLVGAWLLGF